MTPSGLEAVRDAERLAHRTWPCREEEEFGGWILRAADGYSRRANSALAIGVPAQGVEAAMDHVERWYRNRGIQPCVKITPLTDAGTLAALDRRGWTTATPSLVMRRESVGHRDPADDLDLAWSEAVGDEWFQVLACWDGEEGDSARRHRALLERMLRPRFASLHREGRLAGTLVASLEGDQAHLYDLVIDPFLRGQGIGSAFLQRILSDLSRDGVRTTTLQVLESNTVARSLYAKTGFVEVHRYHYREAPDPEGS